jgi:hypothetical protein
MTLDNYKIKVKTLFNLGLIISMFPWVSFGLNEMGMQPYFIMTQMLVMMIFYHKNRVVRKFHMILLLPFLFTLLQIANGSPLDLLFVRDFLSYFAFCLSFVFFYEYLTIYGFPKRLFFGVLCLWILACFPQLIFGEHIYSSLIFSKSSASRGFSSLASEPSFFGLHTAIISSLLLLFSKKEDTVKFLSLGIIALLLSGSLTAFVYYTLFLSIVLILTKRLNLQFILLIIFIISIGYYFILKDQRFGSLVNVILDVGFLQLLALDESSGSRIGDILTPYLLSYYNNFLPMGRVISELGDQNLMCLSTNHFESIRSCEWLANDNKIGSYLGSFLFHFGFLFFPFIAFYLFQVIRDLRSLLTVLIFVIVLMTTIPTGYPLVSFFIAAYLFFMNNTYKVKYK